MFVRLHSHRRVLSTSAPHWAGRQVIQCCVVRQRTHDLPQEKAGMKESGHEDCMDWTVTARPVHAKLWCPFHVGELGQAPQQAPQPESADAAAAAMLCTARLTAPVQRCLCRGNPACIASHYFRRDACIDPQILCVESFVRILTWELVFVMRDLSISHEVAHSDDAAGSENSAGLCR